MPIGSNGVWYDDGSTDADTAPFVVTNPTNPTEAPYVAKPYVATDKTNLNGGDAYTGGSDDDIAKMVADAKASGVQPSLIDKILSGAGGVGKTVTDWAAANPALAKMLGGGLSNAQLQQYQKDLLAQKNQYNIDAQNAIYAHDQLLRDQRNASVKGVTTPDLSTLGMGIINAARYKK